MNPKDRYFIISTWPLGASIQNQKLITSSTDKEYELGPDTQESGTIEDQHQIFNQ